MLSSAGKRRGMGIILLRSGKNQGPQGRFRERAEI